MLACFIGQARYPRYLQQLADEQWQLVLSPHVGFLVKESLHKQLTLSHYLFFTRYLLVLHFSDQASGKRHCVCIWRDMLAREQFKALAGYLQGFRSTLASRY